MERTIREDLLHYVWRTRRFDHAQLTTTDGQVIEIIEYGQLNIDAGPDFSEARVRIGETLWVGQVEMHVAASDWDLHQHTGDPRYSNVILHVVYDYDRDIKDVSGNPLPVLDLSLRIDSYLLTHYSRLLAAESWVPCAKLLPEVSGFKIAMWLESIVGERLQHKAMDIQASLDYYHGDWESVLYASICSNLGLRVNVDAMAALARSLPLQILHKNSDQPTAIRALLYGQAGMLHTSAGDVYYEELRREYIHLRAKYGLHPIDPILWKYSRMRPTAFPTIRIAQMAALLERTTYLFQHVRDGVSTDSLVELLRVTADTYWDRHYRLGAETDKIQPKRLGRATVDVLIINSVVPILYHYGISIDEYAYCERALEILYDLDPEVNTILKGWRKAGIKADNAAHSQALLHLKKHYCDLKRCMSCAIGHEILGRDTNL